MQVLRNKGFSLAALGLFTGFAVTSVEGCGEGGICGPCGTVASGQLSISGDAKLDGFFKAVADLDGAVATINGDFNANIRAIGEAWGYLEAGVEITPAVVTQLIADIRGEISASVSGGVRVAYTPAKCSANVNVAVEAQASCEANAGCEVEADPGEVSVQCEGQCSGGCSAECTGMIECRAPEAGIACEGTCEGSCEGNLTAGCEGTCRGECMGNCSLMNAAGECQGECDGQCNGTCELSAGASCEGTCHGTCVVETDPGGCEGEIGCRGSCSGECSGSCEGSVTPPSASAECDASADCNAQASAQAEANVSCTPPSLELVVDFNASLDASARAAFLAKLDVLRVRGVAILQGAANLSALVTGEVNGEVVFDPSPVANLTAEMQGVIDAGLSAEFEIPPGKIDCVIPALRASVEALADVGGSVSGTISAQAEFSAFLLSPG